MLRICKKILTLQKFTDTMPKGDTDDIKSMSKAENWKVVWSVQFISFVHCQIRLLCNYQNAI